MEQAQFILGRRKPCLYTTPTCREWGSSITGVRVSRDSGRLVQVVLAPATAAVAGSSFGKPNLAQFEEVTYCKFRKLIESGF